jgi:hypothetical protein
MKKNRTILILISSVLTTILAIGLFIFFLEVIKNKNEHASAVLTTLEDKMKEKEDAMAFAGKITEIKSLQDYINSHFLDSNKVDTFVDYLEGIGSNLGSLVSVKSIEISSKTENIISVKLLVSGTFQEVMETIAYLENIPYQVNITQVYLNKNSDQTAQGNVKAVEQSKISSASTWQADVSFDILSLN